MTDIHLTLIGGPTVLIEVAGRRLLTDPTFDPPGLLRESPVRFEKTEGPALPFEALAPIDAVLLSHDQHLDNLDHAGRAALPNAGACYTTKTGAVRLGGGAIGLAAFETRRLVTPGKDDLLITGASARHGPIGIEPISGDVIGFAIGVEQPGDAIYVTGDTVWYEGVAEVAQRFSPRLVILFTGSAEPRGSFHMTMDSNDALAAAQAFPDAALVAVHNSGWAHFKESFSQLAESFAVLGVADRLIPLEPGVRTAIDLDRRMPTG